MGSMDISKYKGKTLILDGDADGVSSGVLLSYYLSPSKVVFPKVFGDYNEVLDHENSIMLDMRPIDSGYMGKVIDHHDGHPEDRKYELLWGRKPTGMLIYDSFKELIPPEHRWKVAISCVGDGQECMIPVEVMESNPELFDEVLYPKKWVKEGESLFYSNYLWFLLSGGINHSCRMGKPELAYRVLLNAKTPRDLVTDIALQSCREEVNKIVKNMEEEYHPYKIGNKLVVWVIMSDFPIESLMATKTSSKEGITVLVLNRKTGKMSIRGILSEYIRVKTQDLATVGGHLEKSGYFGGTLLKDIAPERFLERLGKVLG